MKGKRGKENKSGKATKRDKVGGDIILASQRRLQTDRDENREGVSCINVCEKGWRWGHALQGQQGSEVEFCGLPGTYGAPPD